MVRLYRKAAVPPSPSVAIHLRKQALSNVQSAESMLSLLAPSLTSPALLWFPAVT